MATPWMEAASPAAVVMSVKVPFPLLRHSRRGDPAIRSRSPSWSTSTHAAVRDRSACDDRPTAVVTSVNEPSAAWCINAPPSLFSSRRSDSPVVVVIARNRRDASRSAAQMRGRRDVGEPTAVVAEQVRAVRTNAEQVEVAVVVHVEQQDAARARCRWGRGGERGR